MGMDITVVGSGDAFSSGGYGQTCFHVVSSRTPGSSAHTFLIDCGATALTGLSSLDLPTQSIDAIFFTHMHGDHVGGLPFLILQMMFKDRRVRPLDVFGPPDTEDTVNTLMKAMYPSVSGMEKPFDLNFHIMLPDVPTTWKELTINAYEVRHPAKPSYALRFTNGLTTIAYSGDSEWCENLFVAGHKTDLYILECDGYERPIPGHCHWVELKTHLPRFDTGQMLLTHLGPDARANADHMSGHSRQVAVDGMTVSV